MSRSAFFSLPKAGQAVVLAGAVIAMAIASAFFGLTVKQDEMIRNYIEIAARNYFDSIVVTRRWNAGYGGVYVLKKEGMTSNPYLPRPDIVTTDGQVYTMKNPALMTREISEMARENDGYQYHITSLNLLNPVNAADAWERESLLQFEKGVAETMLITEVHGKKVFRLMRPLFFEAGCVGCHGKQGYAIGDVRGGISVALPYDAIAVSLKENRRQMMGLAALILACFVVVFYLGVWRLLARLTATNSLLAEERKKLEGLNAELDRKVDERTRELLMVNEKAQESEAEARAALQRYQDLYDNAPDMYVSVDGTTAMIIECNQTMVAKLGYSKEEIMGQPIFAMYHPDCMDDVKKTFQLFVETGEVHDAELQLQRKDGSRIDVNLNVSAVRDADGKVVYSRSCWTDITDRKKKGEEIQRLNQELEKRVAERTEKLAAKAEELEKSRLALQYLLEDVNEAKQELEVKMAEIERLNKIFIRRELHMVELKEKVRKLEEKSQRMDAGYEKNQPR